MAGQVRLRPAKQGAGRLDLSNRSQFPKSKLIEFLLTLTLARGLIEILSNRSSSAILYKAERSERRGGMSSQLVSRKVADRRYFIGGSDARIIMGDDEAALLRLWREKRGEIEPENLSGNLIVQL